MKRCLLAFAILVLALGAEPAAAADRPRSGFLDPSSATTAAAETVATDLAVSTATVAVPTVEATLPAEAASTEPEPATGDRSGAVELAPELENVLVDPAALPPDQPDSEEGARQPEGTAEPEAAPSPPIDSPEAGIVAVEPAIERAEISPPSARQNAEDRAELDTSSASAPVERAGEIPTEAAAGAGSAALVVSGAGAEAPGPSTLPAMSKTSALAGELPRSAVAATIGANAASDRVLVPIEGNATATATADRVLVPIPPLADWSAPERPCSPDQAQVDPSGAVAAARFVTVKTAARTSRGMSVPITATTVVVPDAVAAGGDRSAEKPTSIVRPERLSARVDTGPALVRERADLEPARGTLGSAGVEPNPPPWLFGLFALMLAGLSLPIVFTATRGWVRHHHRRALPPPPPAQQGRAVRERPEGIRYRE